jgi:hypothetical protein
VANDSARPSKDAQAASATPAAPDVAPKSEGATQAMESRAASPSAAPAIADDVPTPLIPRPAQLAERPMPSDIDTLY